MTDGLSIPAAAKRLGVSAATIRNWLKSGLLQAASSKPVRISAAALSALPAGRLSRRRNKRAAANFQSPGGRKLTVFAEAARKGRLNSEKLLYLAALLLLEERGEGNPATGFRRRGVAEVMSRWLNRIGEPGPRYRQLLGSFALDFSGSDRLGELHQALLRVGNRSRQGSYYTPEKVVREALAAAPEGVTDFLDPCCGSGGFLLAAIRRFKLSPEAVRGVDLDPAAAELARLNLLLEFPELDFTPNILTADVLRPLDLPPAGFIATNPPWGPFAGEPPRWSWCRALSGRERFGYFLLRALSLLREGGRLSVILPESVLRIKAHDELRRAVRKRCRLERMEPLGRVFPGVFTPSVRLDLVKDETIDREVFVTSFGEGEVLAAKCFRKPCFTLRNRADWAIGIVTGDNGRFLANMPGEGCESVITGGDVAPFAIASPRRWLRMNAGSFQQMAPLHLYRAPVKLIYRFISRRPVFAVDREGRLTLNSANVVIPRLPGVPPEAVAGVFNSSLAGYLFHRRFGTHKVLRGDLEELPIPDDPALLREIAALGADREAVDELLFRYFELDDGERKLILSENGSIV